MQPKNSIGIDEIPIFVVKSSSDYMLFGLCHIFHPSLSQGQFIANKKGQKTNVNNYRPISLLTVLSKILEKIAYIIDCIYFCHNKIFSIVYNLDVEKITLVARPLL